MLASAAAPAAELAIVLQDEVALRPAPSARARPHALLWQGETVEVRGERLEYLQVYDYRRERGGYVSASQLRRLALAPDAAPQLLAVLRFLRDAPGHEALGIGFAAAYIEAAPAEALNGAPGSEALDALGTLAERLARRASRGAAGRAAQAALSAQLEVAARHGVQLVGYERDGRVRLCYEGAAFRRVLAMPSSPAQRARAALALTRPDCRSADLGPGERRRLDEWRAQALDQVDDARLAPLARNRVRLRRAAVWSSLAYQRARHGSDGAAAAARALDALAGVDRASLAEGDRALYNEAALRVSASRWAAAPPSAESSVGLRIVTQAEQDGGTCVLLVQAKRGPSNPLAKRCTYGLVWTASATLNREATALALAVQPAEAWRELWIFHKAKGGWKVRVLPPAATTPEIGYAEFAGWVPGGRRMLVAREATGEGRRTRAFELLRLDTLAPVSRATEPGGAFRRWQDAAWKAQTLSVR